MSTKVPKHEILTEYAKMRYFPKREFQLVSWKMFTHARTHTHTHTHIPCIRKITLGQAFVPVLPMNTVDIAPEGQTCCDPSMLRVCIFRPVSGSTANHVSVFEPKTRTHYIIIIIIISS